ncbi:alginate O-acetyltransferase [Cohaesibacter haloalkalitolerans]|uniref:alginate O-acetyltransferase n=1 Tax=Cohaesibacter haloalkalitolerans TaxID=1162980 RepID=UPI0013C45F49|nr:alginate O-acetyltransferase [Cohaesibacter haloalkalitolerans]
MAEPRSIEGKSGYFYRIYTDLRMHHSFSDETIENLARLSEMLKAKGTTLIYAPVPTKSQAMPEFLPDSAALYGYTRELAVQSYQTVVDRLRAANVVAADLQSPMIAAKSHDGLFFRSDFHWTAQGARLAAEAIADVIKAQPEYASAKKTKFKTRELESIVSFSTLRNNLQRFCKDSLPAVESMAYETTKADQSSGSLDLFGAEATDPIALVGTSMSNAEAGNFGGFISQYSSLALTNYAISGGNQFGSILSYMTSREFQENRPRFLIWENPIYNNLGQYGPAPWVELLAAASQTCQPALEAKGLDDQPNEFVVDLTSVEVTPDQAVMVETPDQTIRDLKVDAALANGQHRTISMLRGDRLRATGRFYFPLQPLEQAPITSLKLIFDRPPEGGSELQLCSY